MDAIEIETVSEPTLSDPVLVEAFPASDTSGNSPPNTS